MSNIDGTPEALSGAIKLIGELVEQWRGRERLLSLATRFEMGDYRHPAWRVVVERRDPEKDVWAILDGGNCRRRDGKWELERLPSNRTEEFIEQTRFTLDEAMDEAKLAQAELNRDVEEHIANSKKKGKK